MTSVGVSAPGMESFPAALVAAITSGCKLGLTTNSAPAAMVSSASFAVVTVPEPIRSLVPYSVLSAFRIPHASGHVMVTSTTVTPPAIIASTTAWACFGWFARSTGIRPTRSMICAVVSAMMIPRSFFNRRSHPPRRTRPGGAPRIYLPRNPRRAALHRALHFGQRRHAGVPRRGHSQRAVRHAALHGPIHGLARKESVDETRRKTVAAADPIENINLALRHVDDLILVERDGTPRIAAGRLRGAKRAGDELQVGIGGGHFAQHLFVAADGQLAK